MILRRCHGGGDGLELVAKLLAGLARSGAWRGRWRDGRLRSGDDLQGERRLYLQSIDPAQADGRCEIIRARSPNAQTLERAGTRTRGAYARVPASRWPRCEPDCRPRMVSIRAPLRFGVWFSRSSTSIACLVFLDEIGVKH